MEFCAIGSPSRSGSTEMRVSSYSSRAPASRITPRVRRAADGEPERLIGPVRIPAVQQQDPSFGVDRQHPGGLRGEAEAGSLLGAW